MLDVWVLRAVVVMKALILVAVAAKSVVAATLLFLLAAGLAARGDVDRTMLPRFAFLLKVALIPSLSFHAVASGLSLQEARDSYMLVLLGGVYILVGLLYGHVASRCVRVRAALRPWYVLAIAVPNMIQLPLILAEALCHEMEATLASATVCVSRATTVLFTVALSHSYLIWLCLYPYARQNVEGQSARQHNDGDRAKLGESAGLVTHQAVDHGAASGGAMDEQSSAPSAAVQDGQPAEAAELAQSEFALGGAQRRWSEVFISSGSLLQGLYVSHAPVIGSMLGLLVAMVPQLKEFVYDRQTPIAPLRTCLVVMAKACPCASNMIAGASLGLQLLELKRDDPLGLHALGISGWAMLVLVVSRIVLVPLLVLCMVLLARPALPQDRWSQLVLIFQPGGVTANVVSLMAQLLRQDDAARMIGLAIIPELVLYVPMATCVIYLGLWLTEDLA